VPQGGRTGLVIGSVPDDTGRAVVLSLRRLNRIRAVDPVNRTMTVDAGCILHDIQQAAAGAGMLFPLSLAAEGSCTIGGNLATNAGGTGVLRYGNTRELCLGLEVVTAAGQLWDGLRGLRKDNTGYDLRDLYIGAEGTLGVITGAVLKLFPQPKAGITALVALSSCRDALALLGLAQDTAGPTLTGYELMSDICLRLVGKHFPDLPRPFPDTHPQYALLELSSHESEQHAVRLLEETIEKALEAGLAQDAVVATSIAQSRALWAIREHIPLAQAADGKNIKHDISVPISRIADFVEQTDALLGRAWPGVQVVCFGHLGDGNLHYNIAPPVGTPHEAFLAYQGDVNRIVHDSVAGFGGSISAEHGIGALKRDELPRYKTQVELDLMRAIKAALDPLGIMNPGKIL
jgi:FAD/FMN-containing dehydrogenase